MEDRVPLEEENAAFVLPPGLGDEPRLPDAGLARDRDDHASAVGQKLEGLGELGDVAFPAHEWALDGRQSRLPHRGDPKGGYGSALPLQLQVAERL